MATPTIPNGEEHFFPIIYEGNGGGQRVGRFVPFTDSGTIDNSCIFNRADTATMSRTLETPTNAKKYTFSAWVKIGNLDSNIARILGFSGGAIGISSNQFGVTEYVSSTNYQVISNRTLEDTSKWYHLMVAVDTTDSTANDRVKLYIDGDRVTSLDTNTQPSQDFNTATNGGSGTLYIGRRGLDTSNIFDGYLAEVNFVDGQQLLPASFGETDTSTGRWVPSTVKPYPTTTTTFTVTVSNPGSGNKYYIDSSLQATVTLIEGATYRFDQSDSSNSGHPLRFSTTSNGTHGGGTEFTSGVTTAGTPGSSGAYTEITVPTGTATLYYYCTNHSGMGGTANTQNQYGNSGWRLKFQDSSALGDDTSGNTNDFTISNLASTDQTTDSPTQNHCTWDPNDHANLATFSEGNLKVTGGSASTSGSCRGTLAPKSGKYYFEIKFLGGAFAGHNSLGIRNKNVAINSTTSGSGITTESYHWRDDGYAINGTKGQMNSGFSSYTTNDYIGVAMDLDTGKVWMSKNGTYEKSGNPETGANPMFTIPTGQPYAPWWLGYGYTNNNELNCGQRAFNTDPPTGFSALQQDNLPEKSKGVSGLVWTKNRDTTDNQQVYDSSRGKQKAIFPNTTDVQATVTDGLQKFLAGGQQIEDDVSINTSGESYVSWNWVANGGTTASNSDGSTTSTVQANTTAGFSIVRYTGTGGSTTVGHGLSSTPEWIFGRPETQTGGYHWSVYHKDLTSASYYLSLNQTIAQTSDSNVWGSAPTSSIINLGVSMSNSSQPMILYCWHGVDGFSKFGKYVGNGSTDGPFVYTGFRPAMVMVKSSSNSATNWEIRDNLRSSSSGNNPITQVLYPNLSSQEYTTDNCDFLSNGFKWRSSGGNRNESGYTYIYMAFADHPFVGDGTNPVTAR